MGLKYKIKISDEALEELDNICEYLKFVTKSDILADRLVAKIQKNIERLSSSPEICSIMNVTDQNGNELRRMVIGKYLVIYYIIYEERIVYISHIVDGRSNYLKKIKFKFV